MPSNTFAGSGVTVPSCTLKYPASSVTLCVSVQSGVDPPLVVVRLADGQLVLPLGVPQLGVLHLQPARDDSFDQQPLDRGGARPEQLGP